VPDPTPEILSELACPRCHAALAPAAGGVACHQHGVVGWWGADGVLEFDRSETYWGEVDRDRMRRIVAAARAGGWRRALDEELRPAHPELVDYVHHAARGDWFVLLPLDRARTVAVDVGAGWGANSLALAPHVARVFAVEKIAERIAFVNVRARQDGVTGVVPVRADLHALPFAPESIDVVVVNGVLEWAGLVDPEPVGRRQRSPRLLQEQFLLALARMLRPGGWIYVGIENRFGRMFWRGTPDHQGLRFTSLMPRPLARAYTALAAATSPRTYRAEHDYRTYTYSFGGYRRLLESCGFCDVRRFAAIPGYNVPARLVPLETPGPMLYLVQRERSARRVRGTARRLVRSALAMSGIEARVSSCFALLARRAPEVPR
jgi:SAM-dependent methyltransferase